MKILQMDGPVASRHSSPTISRMNVTVPVLESSAFGLQEPPADHCLIVHRCETVGLYFFLDFRATFCNQG